MSRRQGSRRLARRAGIAGTLVAALALAACGGGGSAKSSASTAKVDPNAVLVYGSNLSGTSFTQNLQPELQRNICDFMVGSQVFSSLIRRDTKTNAPKPALAESWQIVTPRQVKLTLRPNLVFQDGTKLDAAAAKAALDRNRATTSALAPTMKDIDHVDVVDDRTLVVSLSTDSAAILPLTLAGREGEISAASSTNTHPVGAGPFKFESQRVGEQIDLVKFDGYWDAKDVKLAGIRYVNTSGPAAMNALVAGEIDLMEGNPDINGPAESNSDLRIERQPGIDYYKLNLNLTKAPFDNKAFRQAVEYAVDRKAIADVLFRGQAAIATQPYPATFQGQYQASLAGRYPHDVSKAKQLIQQSGLPQPVTFTAFYTAGIPTFQRFAEIVQQQLQAVGVKMDIVANANPAVDYYRDKKASMFFTLWPTRGDPSITIQAQFTPNQRINVGNYDDPTIDDALKAIRGSTDAKAQAQGYATAVKTIVEDALDVPIAIPDLTYPHRAWVVSDDWQLWGACQGVDFSRLAITVDKGKQR